MCPSTNCSENKQDINWDIGLVTIIFSFSIKLSLSASKHDNGEFKVWQIWRHNQILSMGEILVQFLSSRNPDCNYKRAQIYNNKNI